METKWIAQQWLKLCIDRSQIILTKFWLAWFNIEKYWRVGSLWSQMCGGLLMYLAAQCQFTLLLVIASIPCLCHFQSMRFRGEATIPSCRGRGNMWLRSGFFLQDLDVEACELECLLSFYHCMRLENEASFRRGVRLSGEMEMLGLRDVHWASNPSHFGNQPYTSNVPFCVSQFVWLASKEFYNRFLKKTQGKDLKPLQRFRHWKGGSRVKILKK